MLPEGETGARQVPFASNPQFELLCSRLGKSYPAISEARRRAVAEFESLASLATTPLGAIATALFRAKPETAQLVLSAYDAFLAAINDIDKRKRLSALTPGGSYTDSLFNELRDLESQVPRRARCAFPQGRQGPLHTDRSVRIILDVTSNWVLNRKPE
jgi:hypothetical protein